MKHESWVRLVGILIEMINAGSIEAAGASFDSMNNVALVKQEFSQVTTVLTRDTSD